MSFNILTADFWEKECGQLPNVVFCPMEGIKDLFDKWEKDPPFNKVILISAYSDYGLCYQNDQHPNQDLRKRLGMVNFDEIAKYKESYISVELCGAKKDRCDNDHLYSIKIDSLTDSTIDRVPDCVWRWYATNCNVEHHKIHWIPFGMNEQGHGKDIVASYNTENKTKLLYINFQDYSYERINLKAYYGSLKNQEHWLTVVPKVCRKIEDFYTDLASHVFVLCPFGNGLDSYRIWETLAVGSIPVVQDCVWSRGLMNLGIPVVLVDNMFGLSYNNMMDAAERINKQFNKKNTDLSTITKDYWFSKINEAVAELNQSSD